MREAVILMLVMMQLCLSQNSKSEKNNNFQHGIESINEGKIEAVEDFFKRRMNNRQQEKVQGKRCEILYEDDKFLYYGYPIGSQDEQYVNELYKVNRIELIEKYPNYEDIEGYHVKEKSLEICNSRHYGDKIKNQLLFTNNVEFEINLKKNIIQVFITYKDRVFLFFNKRKTYELHLDYSNLSLISIK